MADNRYLDQYGLNHYHNLIKTEKVVATQTTSTNQWTGKIDATGLSLGKTIILTLPEGSPDGNNYLTLTLGDGSKTKAIPVVEMSGQPLNRKRAAGDGLVLVYDGSNWWNTSETTEGKNTVGTYAEITMEASKWSGNGYSFESSYPSTSYDIEITPGSNATIEQLNAFNDAKLLGKTTANVVEALGDVPTIDIPVTVRITTESKGSGSGGGGSAGPAITEGNLNDIINAQYTAVFGG